MSETSGGAAHMESMENLQPQRTPDQHLPIYEHLDMTTLNRRVTEALWARDIGAEAAAASPLSAQPLEVREQYFDLVAFMVRHLGPAIGDLGHRLGADGKPNPFVTETPAPAADAELDEGDYPQTQAEEDAAAMRAALDSLPGMSDAQLWAGFGLNS